MASVELSADMYHSQVDFGAAEPEDAGKGEAVVEEGEAVGEEG